MSYKIIIKAEAGPIHIYGQDEDERTPTSEELQQIATNAVEWDDNFSDYMKSKLASVLTGGSMYFKYSDNQFFVLTAYESSRKLTKIEQKELIEYTQGQWSDGIGESYEQEPACYLEDDEVYISPWFLGQTATCTQEPLIL